MCRKRVYLYSYIKRQRMYSSCSQRRYYFVISRLAQTLPFCIQVIARFQPSHNVRASINCTQRVAFNVQTRYVWNKNFENLNSRKIDERIRIFQSSGVTQLEFSKTKTFYGNKSCFVIGNCNLLEQSLAENQFQWKIVISNNRAW